MSDFTCFPVGSGRSFPLSGSLDGHDLRANWWIDTGWKLALTVSSWWLVTLVTDFLSDSPITASSLVRFFPRSCRFHNQTKLQITFVFSSQVQKSSLKFRKAASFCSRKKQQQTRLWADVSVLYGDIKHAWFVGLDQSERALELPPLMIRVKSTHAHKVIRSSGSRLYKCSWTSQSGCGNRPWTSSCACSSHTHPHLTEEQNTNQKLSEDRISKIKAINWHSSIWLEVV